MTLDTTLLRVLENKRVMRVGGKGYKQVDFRLISATNRNLSEMASQGLFREDLLYRLSVLSIGLPPLRERKGDALFFARYFLGECDSKTSYGKAVFSDDAVAFISSYSWPGNIRQLKHAIYSAYYTCEKSVIEVDDFPAYLTSEKDVLFPQPSLKVNDPSSAIKVPNAVEPPVRTSLSEKPTPEKLSPSASEGSVLPTLSLRELERLAIDEALKQTNGDVLKAAKLLGVSKATMYRKLKNR